jgi:TolB protein
VPAWLDGHTILVGIRTDTDQRLVKLDVDTGARQDLLVYDGAITFLPDPAGTRLAYQVVPQSGGGGAGGRVSYPFPQTQPTTPPDAAQGELTVLDLANGQSTRVVDHSVQAFQWSPDGSRLAFLDSESSGASRWRFWSPSAIVDGVVFMPSPTFVELIEPYFDQLATSARWWSPDSSAFTFAGRIQGRDGVWALPIGATSPTLVHDGELSTWSPR